VFLLIYVTVNIKTVIL